MNLSELIQTLDTIKYNDTESYKVISSKQKELVAILKPTTNINKIDYKLINKYKQTLIKKGNSPATVNSKLSYLSSLLKYAYTNNLIEHSYSMPYMKIKARETHYITLNELLQMLKYCRTHNYSELRQALLIGYYTGIRINNILSIKPEDIDLEHNYIRVWQNKTNKPYSVPIKKRLLVILSKFKGFNSNYQQIYYQFTIMKRYLGLDDSITIHKLRHTFCSRLVQKGVALPVIQKLANHSSITTTMIYTHIANKQLEDAISVL